MHRRRRRPAAPRLSLREEQIPSQLAVVRFLRSRFVRFFLGTATACSLSRTAHGNPMSSFSLKGRTTLSVNMKTPTPTTWATMACTLSWTPAAVAFVPPAAVTGSIKQVSISHTEVDSLRQKRCFDPIFNHAAYLGVMWLTAINSLLSACGLRNLRGNALCCWCGGCAFPVANSFLCSSPRTSPLGHGVLPWRAFVSAIRTLRKTRCLLLDLA